MDTVIVTPEGEEPAAAEASEVAAVAEAEAVVAVAEASVEIAEVEAARDVEIAEIQAESAEVQAEAFAETANYEQELSECRQRIEVLERENLTLTETVASLTQPSLIVEEEPLPNPSNPESVEVDPPAVEEVAEEVKAPSPRRKLRWI